MKMMFTLGRLRHLYISRVFELVDANTARIIYSLFIRKVIIFHGFKILFNILKDSLLSSFLVSQSLRALFLF